jgi:8-hydroxy-5-deazaflavin:NADPH oxidoreductase
MPEAPMTAIVGVGNIGRTLARHLSRGGVELVVAANDVAGAKALADELGSSVRASSVEDAISDADAVIFALWLDDMKQVIQEQARLLEGKVVVDVSNPVNYDTGQPVRTLPEDQSAGSIVAKLVPPSAHYVKAFCTLDVDSLAREAFLEPFRAVLYYATDDDIAATAAERLIHDAGFDALKAGGVDVAGRLEFPGGDLNQYGPNGGVLFLDQGRAAVARGRQPQ